MTVLHFLTRPEVLFCFGLAAVVAVIGIVLAKVRLTGRIVLASAVMFFGVIIAVNLVLANRAISTFPGIEVANGYIASQNFDKRRIAQENLGWTLVHQYERGQLHLAFADRAGAPVEVDELVVLVGRATAAADDVTPEFTFAEGVYHTELALADGLWMLKVTAKAKDGTLFEQRREFVIRS